MKDISPIYNVLSAEEEIVIPKEFSENMNQVFGGLRIGATTTKATTSNLILYEAVVDAAGYGDYLTIQAALAAGKKRIFVRAGTYNISPTSFISLIGQNFIITGENKNNTIIKAEASVDPSYYMIHIGNNVAGLTNKIIIENITIDGNKANQSGAEPSIYGIVIFNQSDVKDVIIQNCNIINMLGVGFYVNSTAAKNIRIQNNYFFNGDNSGVNSFAIESLFVNNIFESNSSGILSMGNDNVIEGNILKSNNTNGIYIQGNRNLISGNFCKSNGNNGIHVNSGDNNLVVGNKVYANLYNGIVVSIGKTSIIGNQCVGNSRIGISVPAVYAYISIVGNTITNNGYEGIKITGSHHILVSNNLLRTNSIASIGTYNAIFLIAYLTNYVHRNIISGNMIDATNSPYGIRENSANDDYNIVTNNSVKGASTAQISLQGVNSINANNIVT